MYNIENKVAIVLGGGGGIGSEIAHALAMQGCKIAVVDNNEVNGLAVSSEIAAISEAEFFKCDISKLSEIENSFQKILTRFGQADILVNAAGIPVREFIDEIDEEVWERFVSINIKSAFFFCKLFSEHVKGRKSAFGRIVNISSVRADSLDFNHTGYTISKSAVNTITKCFAVCYGENGITCNAIAPGFVETPMTEHYMEDESTASLIKSLSPLGRMVSISEVAALAVFLCSEQAAAINGQVIKIDGGGTSSSGVYH
jgi:NAD(P)-dependent dehydrogenase (short-subunit alcohol dehydrogenase family)